MPEENSKQHFTNEGSNMNINDDEDDNEVGRPAECGIGRIKPRALQMCANMAVFTGTYSFCSLLSSSLMSYVNSQVTTLERHFGFTSSQTGLIMAANDVGFLAVVLLVSYVAARVHIPRALGFVTVLFGVSGIMCALPQFMFGAPSPVSTAGVKENNISGMTPTKQSRKFSGQLCDGVNDTSSDCAGDVMDTAKVTDSQDLGNQARANAGVALMVIVVGMALQGVAKAPRYPFTTTFVDDNVQKTKTGFYMGIIIALSIMGPAVAYALGSVFTRIYVTLEETDMHFRHPKWIGAWWLGFITFGSAACVFAFPLFCFPRRVKGGKQRKKPATKANKVGAPKMVSAIVKDFLLAMLRLWTNPIYIFSVASSCALLFSVAGKHAFIPKYIENQFAFPAWKANMSMAGMMLFTACLGTFAGGYLSKRLKMGPLFALKFVVGVQTLSAVSTGLMMAFKCDQPYLYNSPGPRSSEETKLFGCHDDCACDDDDYFPVCGDDGRSFFSPCHAGCLQSVDTGYANCSCIAGGTATAGMCDYSCPMFIPFMISMSGSTLFGTFSIIPKLIIYIRSVEERDRALALGFSSFMSSMTGWMLGPICFGKLIDGICIQWENNCSGSGACRLYDNEDFRLKLLGYMTLFRFLGLMFISLAFIAAKVTKKFENTETEQKDVDVNLSLKNGEEGDNKSKEKITGPI